MTQPSRTTETINRDNAAIRDIMHRIRELTVPDRATLALGLIGHLATMMNRSQMAKLMAQLQEEAERVQDVPPNRQRSDERAAERGAEDVDEGGAEGSGGEAAHAGARASTSSHSGGEPSDVRANAGRMERGSAAETKPHGDELGSHIVENAAGSRERVGQAGRGEFRSRRLL